MFKESRWHHDRDSMFRHRMLALRSLLAVCVVAPLLAACTFGSFRVQNPPQLVAVVAGTCPNLAGTYAGRGVRTTLLGGGDCYITPCDDLMAQFTPRSSVDMIPSAAQEKSSSYVRVSQPDDGTLELTEWIDPEMKADPVASAMLRAEDGDFSCKDGLLELPSTKHAMVLVFANAVVTESHAFGRALDGALVMRRTNIGIGHFLTVPNEAYKVEEWVEWRVHEYTP